ncbi:hypothetical protein A0257_22540 (plasmid) [Hymenobacter psoromatis]|nr:hypothetical protein A0257_22540 [Hymenobacter psoromatis]
MDDSTTYQVRWAEMDPNGHMRHSAYADFATDQRVAFLRTHGFDLQKFSELRLGPVTFREETNFLKEVHVGEAIRVDGRLVSFSEDGSRWTVLHTIYKANGRVAATVMVAGAWFDLAQRKLCLPPPELAAAVRQMARSDEKAR